MAEHELKTLGAYYQRLATGEKTFEIRKDDRGYQAGDMLVLREYDPTGTHDGPCDEDDPGCKTARYSGRALRYRVGFIYRQGAGLDCGEYVVMSLLPVNEDDEVTR